MLNGKEFGKAIAKAINLKLENGSAASKAAIARHFGMKPPSLADWVKKGSVSKDKLPELWRYFSDVAGPEHWGMSIREWPSGLSLAIASAATRIDEKKPLVLASTVTVEFQTPRDRQIAELVSLARSMSDEGLLRLLGAASEHAKQYPASQGNARIISMTDYRIARL